MIQFTPVLIVPYGRSLPATSLSYANMEKRVASRHRVLKAAKIEFGGAVIDCSVRNISATGAALEVETPVGVPERFILVITADKQQFSCRVVRRKEKRLGVAFE